MTTTHKRATSVKSIIRTELGVIVQEITPTLTDLDVPKFVQSPNEPENRHAALIYRSYHCQLTQMANVWLPNNILTIPEHMDAVRKERPGMITAGVAMEATLVAAGKDVIDVPLGVIATSTTAFTFAAGAAGLLSSGIQSLFELHE